MYQQKPILRDGLSNLLDGFGIECTVSQKGLLLDPKAYSALQEEPECTKNVRFERIEKIEHVKSSHKYVYDLTVEHTKNMTLLNGIACRDTFHFAGIGSKNVTLGIPRLQENFGLFQTSQNAAHHYQRQKSTFDEVHVHIRSEKTVAPR